MGAIENRFAGQAGRYELFTGHLSERNLYLYEQKLGYRRVRTAKVSENLTLVFLQK